MLLYLNSVRRNFQPLIAKLPYILAVCRSFLQINYFYTKRESPTLQLLISRRLPSILIQWNSPVSLRLRPIRSVPLKYYIKRFSSILVSRGVACSKRKRSAIASDKETHFRLISVCSRRIGSTKR